MNWNGHIIIYMHMYVHVQLINIIYYNAFVYMFRFESCSPGLLTVIWTFKKIKSVTILTIIYNDVLLIYYYYYYSSSNVLK